MTPLAQAMADRGQTDADVAAAAGLTPETVRRLRHGLHPPQPRTVMRIASAVGVSPTELFPDAPPHEPTPLAAELARRQASVREIARAAGVRENSVYAWAAGKAQPTAAKAVRLADALGVPVAQLFAITPSRPRLAPAPGAKPLDPLQVAHRPTTGAPLTQPASAAGPETFVRRIAEVMTNRKLSAGDLAIQAGVARETISRWLTGVTSPQRDAAEKVAAALELRLEPWAPVTRPTTSLGVALAERGWTTQHLADAAGVEIDTARRWLSGRATPSLASAHRLAAVLDRPLIDLFDLQPGVVPIGSSPDQPVVLTAAEVFDRPVTGLPQWQDDAACASDDHPDRWWPEAGDPGLEARAACGTCPVLGDCRDAFLAQPDRPSDRDGIWAGLLGHQLRNAARARAHDQAAQRLAPDELARPAPGLAM